MHIHLSMLQCNCARSIGTIQPGRQKSGKNWRVLNLDLWGAAAHQEALSVLAQRHWPTVKQTLQAAEAERSRKISSPLTSQGQPKKTPPKNHPLPTILLGEREEKQQDGEKGEDEREQRRAVGFTASLLSVLLSVCVTGTQLVTQHAAGVSEVRGCGWSLPVH